jgi:predicted AAA+ superfamily ATPase
MLETKIWPVEEMVHEDEFTDRVELLRELDQWIKAIGRMGSWSTALIAPRRIGKTVLLDRLVNTVLFQNDAGKKNLKRVSFGIRHYVF